MRYWSFIFVFFLLLLAACSSGPQTFEAVMRPVKYETCKMAGGGIQRTFSGSAEAGVATALSFKVSGNVQTVHVRVGNLVSQGVLIAQLDPSDYRLQYEEADAAVKSAEAQEKQAKSNYQRISILYENNNTSLAEYDAAKASYESALANKSAAIQRRSQAASQLNYTRLVAPIAGIINNRYVEENENVSAGQQIVTITSGDSLEVHAGIPESFISRIRENQPVSVSFPSLPGKSFEGTVVEISYAINPQTATYPVTVDMLNATEGIRPGMAANITFQFSNNTDTTMLIIPPASVGEDQNGNFVFVLESAQDNTYTAHKRPIKIGRLINEGFEIQEGLAENELVATAGLQTLLDNMKVTLQQ